MERRDLVRSLDRARHSSLGAERARESEGQAAKKAGCSDPGRPPAISRRESRELTTSPRLSIWVQGSSLWRVILNRGV